VVTRQILPVFFTSTPEARGTAGAGASTASQLAFSAQSAKGGYNVTIKNSSSSLLRIGSVALLAGGQEIGRTTQGLGNVLPKSAKRFFVPAKGGGRPQQIQVLEGPGVEGTYPIR